MTARIPPWGRHLALAASYAPLHWLLLLPANIVWHPPAGLRFAWLVMLPMRWWIPLAAWLEFFYWLPGGPDWRGGVPFLAHVVATGAGPWLFRRQVQGPWQGTAAICWLLGAMLLTALANAVQLLAWPPGWAHGLPRGPLFLQLVLGDYIGMLLVAPLALLLLQERPSPEQRRRWRIDVPLVLVPLLALLAWLLPGAPQGRGYLLAACIALAPAIYMALRTGWRGVALVLSAGSLLIGLRAWDAQDMPASVEGQLSLALTGSVLLLLGAAAETLQARQRELEHSNRALQALSDELRSAARRNLEVSEQVRRWITSELHDELGQNLTALQTRLMLVERRTNAAELLRPAWEIVGSMRQAISSLMSSLRPASLDAFGLRQALEHGPVRKLVESAGLSYEARVEVAAGALERMDDALQTAVYRIVQESATNTVRHAGARNFRVRLRNRGAGTLTLLACDDGHGATDAPGGRGMGLQGIRDRVISLRGRMRLRSDARGTRLLVTLPVATSEIFR